MSDLDILDDEFKQPSLILDENKLSAEYVPENLLFRDDDLRFMARHFRGLFTHAGLNRGLIVTGPIGTGKTSITKKFGLWAEKRSVRDGFNLRYVHINCRRNRTPYMILLAIAKELNSHVPARGYSASELMEIIVEILDIQQIKLLLVLDEVDYYSDENLTDLLYSLTRSSDELQNARHLISLILVARSINFVKQLDESTKSSLTTANLQLKPYSKGQLVAILEDRISQAFETGVVTPDSIELAAEIASHRGDARQALELIWYGGKFADQQNDAFVYPEHIRQAKANVDPSLLRRTIEDLTESKKLLLLGIARELRISRAAHITTGDAKKSYHMMCEEYKTKPRKHTQFWEYLKEFEKLGIIVSEISSKGQRGTTQLISIQDATATELENAVEKHLQQR